MTAHVSDQDVQRDAISGARILVGDMLMWSDLATLETPLAVREVLRTAIAEHRPRRVLLAGPRAGLLVDAVPTDVRVDLLVRALPDARLLGDRAGLHESSDIYCGGLDVFAPGHSYDLIVALGGPERLLGPDSRGLSETETVARLAALLDDGGRLVLDLANEMGFTDLVLSLPTRRSSPTPDGMSGRLASAPGTSSPGSGRAFSRPRACGPRPPSRRCPPWTTTA